MIGELERPDSRYTSFEKKFNKLKNNCFFCEKQFLPKIFVVDMNILAGTLGGLVWAAKSGKYSMGFPSK